MRKNLLILVCGLVIAMSTIGLVRGEVLAQWTQNNQNTAGNTINDITEECCKSKATFKWTLNGIAKTVLTIVNGDIIGPTTTSACKSLGTITQAAGDEWAMVCLIGTIYTVTNWIFIIMMIVAVLMIVIGGIMYMTAGQSPDNAAKGKNFITFAIIGLVVALIARFIPPVVKFFLGVK